MPAPLRHALLRLAPPAALLSLVLGHLDADPGRLARAEKITLEATP
ncbi:MULTISPECIES: hypothetical protein [Streptomycetaceae]|nr:hypothetical protein [Streptomyces sp. CB02056]